MRGFATQTHPGDQTIAFLIALARTGLQSVAGIKNAQDLSPGSGSYAFTYGKFIN